MKKWFNKKNPSTSVKEDVINENLKHIYFVSYIYIIAKKGKKKEQQGNGYVTIESKPVRNGADVEELKRNIESHLMKKYEIELSIVLQNISRIDK